MFWVIMKLTTQISVTTPPQYFAISSSHNRKIHALTHKINTFCWRSVVVNIDLPFLFIYNFVLFIIFILGSNRSLYMSALCLCFDNVVLCCSVWWDVYFVRQQINGTEGIWKIYINEIVKSWKQVVGVRILEVTFHLI